MNKRIKKKWLKALRSGEYKQTTGGLREVNLDEETMGFCCLGVLCNIHAQEHPDIAKHETSPYEYLGASGLLPFQVAKWAGLTKHINHKSEGEDEVDIDVRYKGEDVTLANLNDTEKLSFKKIANVIERCL